MVWRDTAQFGPRGVPWGLPAAALIVLDLSRPLRTVEMYVLKGCAKWQPSATRGTVSGDQVRTGKKNLAPGSSYLEYRIKN